MTESRRGNELAEMSSALRAHASKANPTKDQQHARRALFQRIIQYLTIGIDMSPLFSDVIMNAHTKDMATKKMLYHYLTFYAQQKPDLALLTVNTLQKDCADEDPVIRGLAVRSMASMRVPDLVEYLVRVFFCAAVQSAHTWRVHDETPVRITRGRHVVPAADAGLGWRVQFQI